jgi:hypothetical protein
MKIKFALSFVLRYSLVGGRYPMGTLSFTSTPHCGFDFSDSESELLYDWRFTTNQFVLATSPLRLASNFIFPLNTYGYSTYGSVVYNCFWSSPAQLSQVRVPLDSWPHFIVSDSRLHQPGGWGPRIYIPEEQGRPVIPPGTGFHFHRLLRLPELRWRYSTPPPHSTFSTSVLERMLGTDHIEHISSNSSFVVAYVFVAAGTCLPSCCLATAVPLFRLSVVISVLSC